MMRSTFSITTIASSTRMPIAITIANSVSTLIEKPSSQRPRHAPASAIGTTIVGISVARQFWRKRNMTRKTRIIASISVSTTDSTDARTNGVESYGHRPRDVLREADRQLRHPRLHRLGDGERVRARRELDRHPRRRLAVHLDVEAVASARRARRAPRRPAGSPSRRDRRGG